MTAKPAVRPARPFFSSGPCAKRPGWTPAALSCATIGRSHRSNPARAKLKQSIELTRSVLGIPKDYSIMIAGLSGTGAIELVMWLLLGPLPVDCIQYDVFGEHWLNDISRELKIRHRVLSAPFGQIPDLTSVSMENDVVVVWNATTSGARIPNADWITDCRQGLIVCDATSAAFAMELPWSKLDAVTFSWQKGLGVEPGHSTMVFSPRAVERLKFRRSVWPIPRVFRITAEQEVPFSLFQDETLTTVSMLTVEDYLDGLIWAQEIGGLSTLIARTEANYSAISHWLTECEWLEFLTSEPILRSRASVCLKLAHPRLANLPPESQRSVICSMASLLEKEGVAYDVIGHRLAPPGLRIWCGPTVDRDDTLALTPWLDWAFHEVVT